METKVVPLTASLEDRLKARLELRTMSAEEFIDKHASGTLRKNKRLGMVWKPQYLTERIAYEFGWGFEYLPRSRVLVGDPITEGDQHAVTEAGWHIERYLNMSIFPEDKYSAKYIQASYPDGKRKEGIGILVEQTSAPFLPACHVVYAIVSEYDVQAGRWKDAQNPF